MGGHDPLLPGGVLQSLVEFLARLHVGQRRLHVSRRPKVREEPRDSAKTRIRNRCKVSGRPRGYDRKLRMSRIALRDLASMGQVPGVVKSSW